MKLISTKDYKMNGVKILVYGKSGVGKTYLCSTAPNPFIISCEGGLLSLIDYNIPAVEIRSIEELDQIYDWITKSKKAKNYDTICIDPISEIAEMAFTKIREESENQDGRVMYPLLYDTVAKIVRKFRDIKGKHVYFISKEFKTEDENLKPCFTVGMPGSKLKNDLPYFFDVVCRLIDKKIEKNKKIVHVKRLCPVGDPETEGKARTGKVKLKKYEPANLTKLFEKITRIHEKKGD